MANRSEVGVEAGRLHPEIKVRMRGVKRNFVLFMVGLDGFKITLLARQNLRAETPAIRAEDFFIGGTIFREARHTLRLGRYKTEAQLRLFRKCALAQFFPMPLNGILIEFREFAEGEANLRGAVRAFMDMPKNFIEKYFGDLEFAHHENCT